MRRAKLLLLATIFLGLGIIDRTDSHLSAQQISSQEALDMAASYLQHERGTMAPERGAMAPRRGVEPAPLSIAYTAQSGDETYYYAINQGEEEGFVIVGGHEAAREVLGYVPTGHFCYDSIPPAMRWLLSTYQEQIHQAYNDATLAQQSRAMRRTAAATTRQNVGNFLPVTWNQTGPYNLGIFGEETTYPIGCVNTAMAQIMKYYNHPAQATNDAMDGIVLDEEHTTQPIEANRVLDFTSMLNDYSDQDVTTYTGSNKAVADLMYLVARLNKTIFRPTGGSSWDQYAASSLVNYLDYDQTLEHLSISEFSAEEWDERMYTEMAAHRPVIYSGYDSRAGGHVFVLSGYKDSKYYVNWGWGGQDNGEFALNALYVYLYKFEGQSAVTHIKKNEGGLPWIDIKSYAINQELAPLGLYLETTVTFNQYTYKSPFYSYQLKLKDKTTGEIVELYPKNHQLMSDAVSHDYTFTSCLPETLIPGRQYEVLLYYHNNDGNWRQFVQDEVPVITVTHQLDFKSFAVDDKIAAPEGVLYINYTFSRQSPGAKIPYDLCARLTNTTQGTDTLIVVYEQLEAYQKDQDQTKEVGRKISGTNHIGDKIQIEAGYRVSGQTEWIFIDQDPIEITLKETLELYSYQIDLNGDQYPFTKIPLQFEYLCRSDRCRRIDLGYRYLNTSTGKDTTVVFLTNKSFSRDYKNQTYTYNSIKMIAELELHRSYQISAVWRWQGETEWRDFPAGGTPGTVRIVPDVTYQSFSCSATEVPMGGSATYDIGYSRAESNSTLPYGIGVHLKGLNSRVDTVLIGSTSFKASKGENLTYSQTFTLPDVFWLDEEVQLWGCYKERGGEWTDIAQAPATFVVKPCYELQGFSSSATTASVGGRYSVDVSYRSLHTQMKPTHTLGIKLHNLTTSMPDKIIESDSGLAYTASTTEYSTRTETIVMPIDYNVGDRIEVKAIYRPKGMTEWLEVPGDPIEVEMTTPTESLFVLGASVANDGYITAKNFEIHLVLQNNLAKATNWSIILRMSDYQGDITFNASLQANETKEFVVTPDICTKNGWSTWSPMRSLRFTVYYRYTAKLSNISDSPILHLMPVGDVTHDNKVNSADVQAVATHLLDPTSHPLSTASRVAADCNADGRVTIGDLTQIVKVQK